MKKQKKLHSFIEELVLALCTIIMLVPIYYLVLGAFKDRKDIIKYPLLLTKELFTLENFPYVINKMKYWQALANTVTITLASLVIVIICASLAGFAIARSGRPGPVLIDIPCDVQIDLLKKSFDYTSEVNIRGYKPSTKGNNPQMHKVVAAINKAKKPLICAGGGVILGNGEECVRQFCEKNNIPLVTTMMGIGVMPKNHPLYFGMLGNNGKPYANRGGRKQ